MCDEQLPDHRLPRWRAATRLGAGVVAEGGVVDLQGAAQQAERPRGPRVVQEGGVQDCDIRAVPLDCPCSGGPSSQHRPAEEVQACNLQIDPLSIAQHQQSALRIAEGGLHAVWYAAACLMAALPAVRRSVELRVLPAMEPVLPANMVSFSTRVLLYSTSRAICLAATSSKVLLVMSSEVPLMTTAGPGIELSWVKLTPASIFTRKSQPVHCRTAWQEGIRDACILLACMRRHARAARYAAGRREQCRLHPLCPQGHAMSTGPTALTLKAAGEGCQLRAPRDGEVCPAGAIAADAGRSQACCRCHRLRGHSPCRRGGCLLTLEAEGALEPAHECGASDGLLAGLSASCASNRGQAGL